MGSSSAYHFVTHWRVEASVEEVYPILGRVQDLPRWWPAVYLAVTVQEPGEPNGLGKEVELFTKGWLPYTLRWRFRVTAVNKPRGYELRAWGDLVGRGIWTFRADGPACAITYDWEIDANKPLLRNLSWLLKPIFAANHEWAMRKGEESLKLELRRHRGETNVPAPPKRTF